MTIHYITFAPCWYHHLPCTTILPPTLASQLFLCMLGTLSSAFGTFGSSLITSCQTSEFGWYPCNTLVSCGIETLAKERHKQTGQLPAPSQSWKDVHQYELNIKQEDLKVYDRIPNKFKQSISRMSSNTCFILFRSYLQDLHTPSIELQRRTTLNDHEWSYMTKHDLYHWVATYRPLTSHTIN